MAHAAEAVIGRSWCSAWLIPSTAGHGPLLAWVRLQVERSELVDADDDLRVALARFGLAVGDGIQLEDPVLLRLEVGVVAHLPGLDALKRDALLAEHLAEPLVADVVDHPLSHEELGQ